VGTEDSVCEAEQGLVGCAAITRWSIGPQLAKDSISFFVWREPVTGAIRSLFVMPKYL